MLSNIVVDFPEIAEIDINPLVIADGKACAVDARIVIDETVLEGKPKHPHLVITPYPTRYVTPWRLSDGTEVLLRPIRPEDEPMEREMLATDVGGDAARPLLRQRRSTSTTRCSCASPTSTTTARWRSSPSSPQGKKKRIIGVGRLMGEADRGHGEFAVLVHDDFQGKGLGFKLTDVIIGIAQEKGLARSAATSTPTTAACCRWSTELGFEVEPGGESGVSTVRLRLV